MRVRVYVDAFNVYYGARSHCGRSVPGWRWLDLAALAMSLINPYVWQEHELERLVYCTAPRDREGDSSSRQDQQTYINALRQHIPKLDIVNGKYDRAPRLGCWSRRPAAATATACAFSGPRSPSRMVASRGDRWARRAG